MERVELTTSFGQILNWCAIQNASDLHAQADRRYAYRVDGKLNRVPVEQFKAPSSDDIRDLIREAFATSIFERIDKVHETDLSFLCGRIRYRANFNKQQGTQSFSL